jgi:hypothetical protein
VADDVPDCFFDLRALEQVARNDADLRAGLDEFVMSPPQLGHVAGDQRDTTALRANLPREH